MAMTKILLDCTDQNLIVTEAPVIASGGINDNMLVINFSAEWSSLAKSAIFFTSNYKTIYEAVLTSGECTIPAEVLTEPATLYIGVRGVNSDDVIVKTSSLVKFKIVPGAPPADGTTVEPTANVYQQLLTAYGKTDNALASEIAEREREVAVERSRIDALVKLPEGSTTGDAELQDIRIGVDGATYESAGTAVREQFNNVSSGIGTNDGFLDRQIVSYNLHNAETSTAGYFLSTDDAVIGIADPAYCFTDYIPVETGDYIIANHPWGAQFSLSWYDRNKNYIAQRSYTEDTALEGVTPSINSTYWYYFIVPENAAYIRVNCKLTQTVKEMIVKGSNPADIPAEYEPYKARVRSEKFLSAMIESYNEHSGIVNTAENTVLGDNALPIAEGVKYNVAVGANALANIKVDNEIDNQSGRYNVAVGGNAMKGTTTGNHNTACGFQAMLGNTIGTANTAVGEDALMVNAEGNYNVAIGCRALQSATSGDDNVAVGQGAGYWNDELHPTGSRNTMIGAHSGQTDGNGSNNISVGYFAKADNGLNHTIVIGNGVVAKKDGQTIIGSGYTVETILRGDLIVMDANDVKRKIVFNPDGSCTWAIVN